MSTPTLPTVTDATFAAAVAPGTGLVAVDFAAPWCGPCRMMEPLLAAAAADYAPTVRFVQMDNDTSPATTARYNVRSLPTLLLFRDGEPVDRIVGAVSRTRLRERLDLVVRSHQIALQSHGA